jgi:hypothetical protein
MRTIRCLYRLFKLFAMAFTLLETAKRSRPLLLGYALWRMSRRRPFMNPRRVAAIRFVGGDEPAIYRRRGLRKWSS